MEKEELIKKEINKEEKKKELVKEEKWRNWQKREIRLKRKIKMTMPKKEQAMKMINDNYEEREMYDS